MSEWLIQVRDSTNTPVAEVSDYGQISLVQRFNSIGTWVIDLPIGSDATAALTEDKAGLIVKRDGTTILSGPVGRLQRKWDGDTDGIIASGLDDSVWLQQRLAYPVPTSDSSGWGASAYDVRTGVASTIMRQYVDLNAGPGALADREILTLAADPLLGDSITGRGRLQTLLELLQELALAGGDLGFRVVQNGTDLEFQVYQPTDKTATVIFSEELGNLKAFDYAKEAPSTNHGITGGGGEGTARTFREASDAGSITAYGRRETFIDQRQTTDTTELDQALADVLLEESEKTSLSISPIDTASISYLTDYSLGDRVAVMVDGVAIEDIVREVRLDYSPEGEVITPTVGTPGAQDPRVSDRFREIRDLRSRLSLLERR